MGAKGYLFLLPFLCSGCATTPDAGPPLHPVSFTSEPDGAVVTVDDHYCITPCTLHLAPGEHATTFSFQGQERAVIAVSKAAEPPRGVGGALQSTGQVLNDFGEMSLRSLEGANLPTGEAGVLVFFSGFIGIASVATGQGIITVGEWLGGAPMGNRMHVVFVEGPQSTPAAGQ